MFKISSFLKERSGKMSASKVVKILSIPVLLLSLATLTYLVKHNMDIRRSAQVTGEPVPGETTFTYDGEGQRLTKTTSEGTTWYPNAMMEVQKDNSGKITRAVRNYYFGGKMVAVRETTSDTTPTTSPTTTPSCSVAFSPPNSIAKGESVKVTAWVTTSGGASVDRVTFSSSNPSVIDVNPITDNSSPYETTLLADWSTGNATITANVYLIGTLQTISCSKSSTVSVVDPSPTSTSTPTPTSSTLPQCPAPSTLTASATCDSTYKLDTTWSWSIVSSSSSYRIQIDNDSNFSSPIVNTTTTSTSRVLNDLTPGTYYGRVRVETVYDNSCNTPSDWKSTYITKACPTPTPAPTKTPTPTTSSCLVSGSECNFNWECCTGICDFVGWTYECQ